jgi:hypothetical protein
MFPTRSSDAPRRTDCTAAASSGSDVPTATIVSPTNASESPCAQRERAAAEDDHLRTGQRSGEPEERAQPLLDHADLLRRDVLERLLERVERGGGRRAALAACGDEDHRDRRR